MRTLIIITAAVLIVAGISASIMKIFGLGPFGPDGEKSEYQTASIGDVPMSTDTKPRFIDMEPIIITIFAEDRVATSIQISLKLEAIGTKNELRIVRAMTKLQDRYLRDLYSYLPRLLRKEERVNVFAVKRRLQMISEKVMGPGIISGVLVQSVVDSGRPGAAPK
jgi:hypothetical protein